MLTTTQRNAARTLAARLSKQLRDLASFCEDAANGNDVSLIGLPLFSGIARFGVHCNDEDLQTLDALEAEWGSAQPSTQNAQPISL